MKKPRLALLFLLLATGFLSRAQPPEIIANYIRDFKDLAIAEMQRTGVPAAIKLAQGIHETGAGTSKLVLKSNNHFGIKCKSNWKGESVSHDDDARGECFRKYPSSEDSYRDHSDFLKNNPRYAALFQLDPEDYEGWANGLKKAGYATNPKYPAVLIRLVEEYHLQDYTFIALGKMKQEEILAKTGLFPDTASLRRETVQSQVITHDAEIVPKQKEDYPDGVFRIHDTKVVFVKEGTSYLAVARRFELPLARIFEFNELQEAEVADRDRLIYLQRKRKSGGEDFHIVKPGETLHDIAQVQAIRLESLLEYNYLRPGDRPAPGEKLSLKKKAVSTPKLALRENYSLGTNREN